MKNYIIKAKEGIILGVFFLITTSVGIFAYENYYVEIEPNIEEGTILSSDTFNQLLTNVNELKSDVIRIDEKVAGIKASSDVFTYPKWFIIQAQTGNRVFSESKELSKGVYMATTNFLPTISDSARLTTSAEKISGDGNLISHSFGYTNNAKMYPALIFVVNGEKAVVRFVMSGFSGNDIPSNVTTFDGVFQVTKISD